MKIGSYKATREDKLFELFNIILVTVITILLIYPLIYVLSASISDPNAVATGRMWLWPIELTLQGYEAVLENEDIWLGFRNSVFYAILGTIIHLVLLLPFAFALSRKELVGHKFFRIFLLITMLFSGGMIPTYLVVDNLGLINTIWAVVIPNAVGAWSIFVATSFFKNSIPEQVIESASIDGAGAFNIFFRIALPLSLPLVAMMAMLHAFSIWNSYFNALIYVSDRDLYPLQLVLREILIVFEMGSQMLSEGGAGLTESLITQLEMAQQVKYAVMVVSAFPLLLIYPFLQKYFVQGTLIGSVKE